MLAVMGPEARNKARTNCLQKKRRSTDSESRSIAPCPLPVPTFLGHLQWSSFFLYKLASAVAVEHILYQGWVIMLHKYYMVSMISSGLTISVDG